MFRSIVVLAALLAGSSHAETLRTRAATTPHFRDLSSPLIAGFEPTTSVTDHNAIDQDQKSMEDLLAGHTADAFAAAKKVYEEGGNSKTVAKLTLSAAPTTTFAKGTEVTGKNSLGADVKGKVVEVAEDVLSVQYDTTDIQATHSSCRVGGLPTAQHVTTGCFAGSGSVTVDGVALTYTYNNVTGNTNARTLRYFSTSADTKMRHDELPTGEFYEDFKFFYDYYGSVDYSDKIVQAAFEQTSVTLNKVTLDFSTLDFPAREQIIKKGSAYMGVAMYVIRELEDAIDDCRASETKRNADGVNAVDEAVAFYTGSLEGADGAGSGVLMYALADKRCVNFKTCGENGDSITGTSDANLEIFDEFKDIKSNVLAKNCDAAVGDKEDIVEDMRIPLIQGTLRYAQILSTDEADAVDKAEGAIFALSILPWLDNCNQDAAKTVFENMSPTATSKVSLSAVKKAIESTYKCLEVSCEDIGGLYDEATGKYLEGSSPCSGDSGVNVGLAVGLSVGGLVVLALVLLFVKRQKAGGVEMKSDDV